MLLLRFAIGTFSLALLGMAFTLGPPPSQRDIPASRIALMHH